MKKMSKMKKFNQIICGFRIKLFFKKEKNVK